MSGPAQRAGRSRPREPVARKRRLKALARANERTRIVLEIFERNPNHARIEAEIAWPGL